ncbi:MAG: NAD(P)-binding domain-containing protein [Planctomycetes bacterium]|nr:NAD(P)-binding domain-containing protein [Planctomycetota bacterium]
MISQPPTPSNGRYCLVGAGSSGLTVAKNLLALGLPFDCFEREDDVGGNWYYGRPASSVYASTHLISSKRYTEYTDFPMPAEYPPYPSHRQAWEYLRSYARHFDLYRHITFGVSIESIEPADGAWRVVTSDGRSQVYRGVVIANGHNWDPRWPDVPGTFNGTLLHSCQYKTPDVLAGRRVLVVGGGNSGCDIAVEAAQHAAEVHLSLRRGYHYVPKFLLGKPVDACNEWMLRKRLPLWLRRKISQVLLRLSVGRPESYGLPRPDHELYETHPIVNSQLPYFAGHGRIRVRPDLAEWCGNEVRFADGSQTPFDVVVCATGFKISFPFIDRRWLNCRDERPELYLNIFHPEFDTLCVAGLLQPDSGQWGLVDYQAQLIARFFASLDNVATFDKGATVAEQFRRAKANPSDDLGDGIHYLRSTRHQLEVEHFSYRERLKKWIAKFDVAKRD